MTNKVVDGKFTCERVTEFRGGQTEGLFGPKPFLSSLPYFCLLADPAYFQHTKKGAEKHSNVWEICFPS